MFGFVFGGMSKGVLLVEMVIVYVIFVNNGVKLEFYIIIKIVDLLGNIVYENVFKIK